MISARYLWASFLLIAVLFSCTPTEEVLVTFEQFDLGVDGEIRSVIAVEDTFYFCGGSGWQEGWVLRGTPDFQEVDLLLEADNLLFDLCSYKNNIYASSLGNALYGVSTDGDRFLQYFIDEFQSIYALEANATNLYAVSGVNARTDGSIWRYNEDQKSLDLQGSYKNSLEDLQLTNDRLLACGFGMTAYCDLNQLECRVDFELSESFKSLACINDSLCFAVAQSGGMAKTEDGGANWYTIRPADRVLVANVPFQDIEMRNDSTGYVCAREGHLWKTTDAGRSWVKLTGLPELDFFDLHLEGPYIYLACSEGQLLRIVD